MASNCRLVCIREGTGPALEPTPEQQRAFLFVPTRLTCDQIVELLHGDRCYRAVLAMHDHHQVVLWSEVERQDTRLPLNFLAKVIHPLVLFGSIPRGNVLEVPRELLPEGDEKRFGLDKYPAVVQQLMPGLVPAGALPRQTFPVFFKP